VLLDHLDHHSALTVKYREKKDHLLSRYYDNSKVTLNVIIDLNSAVVTAEGGAKLISGCGHLALFRAGDTVSG